MGRTTTTAYDNRGWVATVTDPLGNVVNLLVHGDRQNLDRHRTRARAAGEPSRTSTTRTIG